MQDIVNNRDYYIDSVKGLLIISIVLIHTVFWSGISYIPSIMQDFVLIFDVPLFFFITGCVMRVHSSINPLKQMLKLIMIFFIAVLLSQIFTFNINLSELFQPIILSGANILNFQVLSGSYWFVPIYILTLIYAKISLDYFRNWLLNLSLILIPIYYLVLWITNNNSVEYVLGINLQYFLFYYWIMILGHQCFETKGKKYWIYILFFSLVISVLFKVYEPELTFQACKFPVKLPYFILSLISISSLMLFYRKLKNNIFAKLGKNAVFYYLSQGIGSSIIYFLAKIQITNWEIKFIICFASNLLLTLIIGYLFSLIYKNIEKLFIKC